MSVETKPSVKENVNTILASYAYDESMLVSILQDIQAEYRYLSEDSMKEVSRSLEVPVSQVYSVATFFKAFNLKPVGRHVVNVCLGTACHVRGALKILEQLERDLGISPGETTKDLKFTLETVKCVGACALGPMVIVDGEYEGKMKLEKVKPLIERYD